MMEKIIFIACLKTGLMFFVALVFIRYGLIGSLKIDRRRLIVVSPHEYLTKTRFQEAFQSLSKNVKVEELYPYSVTLDDPPTYSTRRLIKHPRRGALVVFLLTFILLGLSVLCWTVRDSLIIKGYEFYVWIPTQGTVRGIETHQYEFRLTRLQFREDWVSRIIYTYEVNGVVYDNRNSAIDEWVSSGDYESKSVYEWEGLSQIELTDGKVYYIKGKGSKENRETAAVSFRRSAVGQPINIVYNPKNPQESIIQHELTEYHDVQLDPELRSKARYGAYLASIAAGAVVFPAALNLLFARRQPRLEADEESKT